MVLEQLLRAGLQAATEYALTLGLIALFALAGLLAHLAVRRGLNVLYQKQYIAEPLGNFLRVLSRWTFAAIVFLLILQQIGVGVTAIWAALSAAIVFIGVGLVAVWSVLSNALCSLLLLLFQPFRIGDEIEIIDSSGGTGLRGTVIHLNPVYTFLEESGDNGRQAEAVVYVPNNTFFQKTIRRWQGADTKRLDVHIFNTGISKAENQEKYSSTARV